MIDKFAGYKTQIRVLERKLKELDHTKLNPSKVKELTEAIKNLKDLVQEKEQKREERRKAKQSKADEVAKEAAPKVEDGTVSMPKKEFVEEHEKLVKELEPMVEEHKEQGAELKEVKEAAPALSPKCAICGVEFKSQPEYQQHKDDAHGHRDYQPMDRQVKKDVVKNVEKNLGPAIISEQEDKAELIKFGLDDVVKPIRGSESTGRVMRWDGKPSDLVYVAWDSGPLADRDGFGGYYPNDLEHFVEETEKVAEGNPPPPDTSIVPKEDPKCPCYEDQSVYCPKCKHLKTSDLHSNYMDMLKDLKEERESHYTQGNHPWVAKLDDKIVALEKAIAEKFGNEKQSAQLEHHDPIGHGMGDLYILPNSPEEAQKIIKFVQDSGRTYTWSKADVEGHKWYGKRFIEVPFGMDIEKDMREHFANTPFYAKPVEEIMAKQAGWNEDMAAAYQRGLADAKAGKPSNEAKEEFRDTYRQGYGHGLKSDKEAGAENDSEGLVVLDHNPPRANKTMEEGGKDENDSEFQSEWAEPKIK